MNTVYIAMFSVQRESDSLIGVYDSLEAAQNSYSVKRRTESYIRATIEWKKTSNGSTVELGNGCSVVISCELVQTR